MTSIPKVLPELGAIDVRHLIKAGPDRTRRGLFAQPEKNAVTWHYNGPELRGVETWTRSQLIGFINRVDVPNHIARIDADGLQYHLVIAPNGEVLQTRDLDRVLWHCANFEGNNHSISIHVPLGGHQVPTPIQLASLLRVTEVLVSYLGVGRERVFGHREWRGAATECPGELLPILERWRRPATRSSDVVVCRVTAPVAVVRTGPEVRPDNIATTMRLGAQFEARAVTGQTIGSNVWYHRIDGLGFVHSSAVVRV